MTPTINPAEVVELSAHDINLETMSVGDNERIALEMHQLEADMRRLEYYSRLADHILDSGTIKSGNRDEVRAQIMLKLKLGHELGMTPAMALQHIDIIQGNIYIRSAFIAQKMQDSGYTWRFVQHDEKACVIDLYYKGKLVAEGHSYTIEDAQQAKLVKDKEDSNWQKSPKNMLFARCIKNAQRFFAPSVAGAGYPTPEEVDLDNVVESTIASKTEGKMAELKDRLSKAKQAEI